MFSSHQAVTRVRRKGENIIFNVSKGVFPSSKKVWWIIHNKLNYSKHLISWLSFHTDSLLICITYPNTKCYGNNRVWKKRVECWEYIKCFSKDLNVEIWTLVWTHESWNHYRVRVLINEREIDKGEVGSSSPPRPTTLKS